MIILLLPLLPLPLLTTTTTTTTAASPLCNPPLSPPLTPSLQSCDYALHRLEILHQHCGDAPITFSPFAPDDPPSSIALPSIFLGAGPPPGGFSPPERVWCALLILWAPRQSGTGIQRDVFPLSRLLGAADRVREVCLVGGVTGTRTRLLGREWVEPHLRVEVQFVGVWGPVVGMGGQVGRVRLAGGGNVSAVFLDGVTEAGCAGVGGVLELGNGDGNGNGNGNGTVGVVK